MSTLLYEFSYDNLYILVGRFRIKTLHNFIESFGFLFLPPPNPQLIPYFIPRLSPPNPAAGGNFWPKEISMLRKRGMLRREGPPSMLRKGLGCSLHGGSTYCHYKLCSSYLRHGLILPPLKTRFYYIDPSGILRDPGGSLGERIKVPQNNFVIPGFYS